jgi:hypothetical protein
MDGAEKLKQFAEKQMDTATRRKKLLARMYYAVKGHMLLVNHDDKTKVAELMEAVGEEIEA